MYFREWILKVATNKLLIRLLAVVITSVSLHAQSFERDVSEYRLTLKPQECVSLYQGQTCYTTLIFTFTAPQITEYCIYREGEMKAFHCWLPSQKGSFSQEFDTTVDVVFTLGKKENSSEVLATAHLSLSWVYKAPNKKRLAWRLF